MATVGAPRAWIGSAAVESRADRASARRALPRACAPRAPSGRSASWQSAARLLSSPHSLSRLRARAVAPAVARGAIAPSRGASRRERTRSRVAPRAAIGGDGHGAAKKSAARVFAPMPPDPSRGADRPSSIATEEDAEVDAASRASRLKALVARKRLYFAVLEAEETTERPVPEKTTALAKIVVDASAPESASALADAADAIEDVVSEIGYVEEQISRLDRQRATLFAATKEEGGDVFGLGDLTAARDAELKIDAKVNACVAALTRRASVLTRDAMPYSTLEQANEAIAEARSRLEQNFEATGKGIDKLPRPVVKTVERVGSRAKSARGLINTGVSKLREKPLSAAASAAEYTKGVWVRLNGGMDGVADLDPRIADLPDARSVAEARASRVLSLTVEVQDCDKALSDASNERDKVMGQGKDSLSRVRLAKSIRERDDEVRDLRRAFATRTLQLEMERILAQLEEEACEAPSLETPDRADEVELLAAEFGAMDAGLRKLAWMVDTGDSASIEDDDLTELATDIPDLKSRLGLNDGDGLSSLSPSVIGERVSRTTSESLEKAKEGAEFMARGVKMLGGDISASARFFGRAVMGSTLRPREVQTIRRTTLDIFTFVPFIIILIIPLTPVGHVLIFSFIQRYFPALFPSQFSGRRQELMKKYEELSLQLKEAEKSKEIAEEDEALKRAVTAVESLMMGGASDAEVAKAARAATAAAEARSTGGGTKKSNSFFKLKGLERMASGEDVVDVEAKEPADPEPNEPMDELETLRRSQESLRSTLSFDDDGVSSSESSSR